MELSRTEWSTHRGEQARIAPRLDRVRARRVAPRHARGALLAPPDHAAEASLPLARAEQAVQLHVAHHKTHDMTLRYSSTRHRTCIVM